MSTRPRKSKEAATNKDDSFTAQEANERDEEEIEEEEGGIRIGDIYVPPPPPPALTFDSKEPRLIITHIENSNFKSYAGKQILGPFHKSFTSIVGPNGSGKSNVIDSMLFVFGYRAQKIRSKKISVLIHNSKNYPNVQSCTVTVHFQKILDLEDGTFEPVAGSAFQVSRTANRDNSSSYSIDNRKVPFKEVAKRLRFHGIDLDHNRFLILQGEVELIAMMKPKSQGEHDSGMLEFVEDIIGCNRFKVPIEQLEKQVEELNELRAEKINRIKVVEKEKDELQGPRDEAIAFLEEENQIVLKKNSFYQKDLNLKSEGKSKAESDLAEVNLQLEEINKALAELRSSMTEKEKEANKKAGKAQECKKLFDQKKAEFEELERQDVAIRERHKHNKGKLKKLKAVLNSETEKLQGFKDLPSNQEQRTAELLEHKAKLEAEREKEEEKLAKVMGALKEDTKVLQEEKDGYESELMGLRKNVDETKSRRDVLQAELDVYLSTELKEKAKLTEITNQLQQLEEALTEKERVLAGMKESLPEMENKLQKAKDEFAQIDQQEGKLKEEVNSKRVRMEEARNRIQAFRSTNKVQDGLYQQKTSGKIPGIIGRLGDLGGIDAKYDVAISTACGHLNHFVTDSIDTAQLCVQYLKDSRVGQCNFIALDKMGKHAEDLKRPFEAPQNSLRLFDLIKVEDESILPAFYFALKNTLVADNLDDATRIGLQGSKRHRVVTLKGEVVDTSGTMSGGGGRPVSGRMGRAASVVGGAGRRQAGELSSEDLQALETEVNGASQELGNMRHRKNQLEDMIRQLEKDLATVKVNQQKVTQELECIREKKINVAKLLNEQKKLAASVTLDQNKVKQMQAATDSAQKEFKKAADEANKIEVKVQKVNDKINEITGKMLSSVQKKVNELKKKIEETQKDINKAGVSAKTAIRNAKKCEETIENTTKEIAETEDAMKEALILLEKMNVQGTEVNQSCSDAEAKHEALIKEMEELQKAAKEFKSKEKKLLEDNIDITSAHDRAKSKLTEVKKAIVGIENKLAKLSLNQLNPQNEPATLPKLTEEELANIDLEKLIYDIQLMEEEHKKKKPNMAAIEEFKKKEALYLTRVKELETVTAERDLKRSHFDQFRQQRLTEFLDGFRIITNKLKEVYQMLTLGGDAELELVDSLDPFSEGIVFSVRPPKKSWKNISNLSGGEKTLSSLALVMALHYYRPTPLYVMDEIDAALDFRNVSIVGHYIKERTKNAQFIVISLRNDMFELADRLVGIYKTDDCTKSVTINPALIVNFGPDGKPRRDGKPGPDGKPGANGKPGPDGKPDNAVGDSEGINAKDTLILK